MLPKCRCSGILMLAILLLFQFPANTEAFIETIRRSKYDADVTTPSTSIFLSPARRLGSISALSRTTTTAAASKWNVGDTVQIENNNNNNEKIEEKDSDSSSLFGIIKENRGSGWYLIDFPDNQTIRKYRSSSFKDVVAAAVDASTTKSENSNNDKNENKQFREENKKTTSLSKAKNKQSIPNKIKNKNNNTKIIPRSNGFNIDADPTKEVRIHDLDALLLAAHHQHHHDEAINKNNSISTSTTTKVKNIEHSPEIIFNDSYSNDKELQKQIAYLHGSIKKWVIFTDLHCAPSTLETSIQVLEFVHNVAMQRNAGVLFLGDFWHHRGTLRVDCLNAVLNQLQQWKVPMVLIPGNHDQITLSGHNHGLTPLKNAYRIAVPEVSKDGSSNSSSNNNSSSIPGPLIFTHPTKFMNALFVPHIRDINIMESVLQSDSAMEANAIFIHADVTGAHMNDHIISLGGIPPRMFPVNKPIFSGHFHKPHTIKSGQVSIEYVGSSYEISLAEAQQNKSLVVLDASKDWTCTERIPISIGKKNFKINTIDKFLMLNPTNITATKNDNNRLCVCAGDRVVLTIDKEKYLNDGEWKVSGSSKTNINPISKHIQSLREVGALVEIRESKSLPVKPMRYNSSSSSSSISTTGNDDDANNGEFETMSPESVWKFYLDSEVNRQALTKNEVERICKPGIQIIQELDQSIEGGSSGDAFQTSSFTDLQLDSLNVEGFGPFKDYIEYPLRDRGLVLVRGINKDGGSDSNGSGKSSLAMAALWVLTGAIDPRPFQDFKASDVINDYCTSACVSIKGTINGEMFNITRTRRKKGGLLVFHLGNNDLTTQSVKETMIVIEEKLGVSPRILARTMFHGQHSLNHILESTDSELKDELSLIVPLSKWQKAASIARLKAREASKKETEYGAMINLRESDVNNLKSRLSYAKEKVNVAKEDLLKIEAQFQEEMDKLDHHYCFSNKNKSLSNEKVDELEELLNKATDIFDRTQSELQSLIEKRNEEIRSLESKMRNSISLFDSAKYKHESLVLECRSLSHKKAAAKEKIKNLESVWAVDLSTGRRPIDFVVPQTCPTCMQSILPNNDGDIKNNAHEIVQLSAEKEIDDVLREATEAKSFFAATEDALESAYQNKIDMEEQKEQSQIALEKGKLIWDENIERMNNRLSETKLKQSHVSGTFAEAMKDIRLSAKVDTLRSIMYSKKEAYTYSETNFGTLRKEVEIIEKVLYDLKSKQQDESCNADDMKILTDAFGTRGVQTFVLQNAVQSLQITSQTYLDEFSNMALKIQLSLDAGDRISRRALIKGPFGSDYKERPLSSLSGGQWRRCSLALALGFAELVARSGKLIPSIWVLDEPLTHLDRSGRADVGRVLRTILHASKSASSTNSGDLEEEENETKGENNEDFNNRISSRFSKVSTILVILQDLAAEELEFDHVDEVVKQDGVSTVVMQ